MICSARADISAPAAPPAAADDDDDAKACCGWRAARCCCSSASSTGRRRLRDAPDLADGVALSSRLGRPVPSALVDLLLLVPSAMVVYRDAERRPIDSGPFGIHP